METLYPEYIHLLRLIRDGDAESNYVAMLCQRTTGEPVVVVDERKETMRGLKSLERLAFVTSVDNGLKGRHRRKTYAITRAGEEFLTGHR